MATATNSLGKVTTYEYNPDTNMLDWVQYPEDKENWDNGEDTRTYYTYDEMYRPERIYATTDTDLDMSVEYTYTDDYLTKVETPTTAYDFTYGDFGLRTSVKIGSRTLAAYRYTNDKNMYLAGLDYGNQDSVNYTYDEKGRLICQTYEDGDTVTYQYDNDGALAFMTDSATGITTRYFYDFIGRAVKYTETGTDYFHSVEYTYDQKNNLSSQIEVINGTTHTTSYEYDDDNRVTSKTTDGITVEYTYDGLGRVSQQVTKNGETIVKTETYTFNANSAQVATYRTQAGGYDVTYTYTYDDNGNILTVNDGTTTTSYVYDSANQLIEAYDTDLEYAWFWTYDNAGNIQSAVLRDYTQCIVDAVLSSHSYTYGDDEWGDLLTAFDGTSITHDGIGNPTSYRGYTLTWEHGRQLASMSQGNQTWEFTYDANGMRTGRKMEHGNQSYSYVYNGDQLVEMDANGIALKFTYDTDGTPLTLQAGDDLYYYVTNLQGDITGILDTNGNLVASYIYDAWGRILSMTGSGVVGYNPLTYRGYVYDFGTGLYYLQSRYYDPNTGRFLNADNIISGADGSIRGKNVFAYCFNNPVAYCDFSGEWPQAVTDKIIHNFVLAYICSQNKDLKWKKTCIYYNGKDHTDKWGFCDLYNSETGEVWELKKQSDSRTCQTSVAREQLENYVNGRLKHNLKLPLKFPDETDIPSGEFPVTIGGYVYEVKYWDEGNGILRYDYDSYKVKKKSHWKETIGAITTASLVIVLYCLGMPVGEGALAF